MSDKSIGELPEWAQELTDDNFLAVYDVVLDINETAQLSDDIVVPLLQPIVKFDFLMPGDGANMRDRYCELRWNAANLLKKHGLVSDVQLLQGQHRWESRLRIIADKAEFGEFAKAMNADHRRRRARKASVEAPEIATMGIKRLPVDEVRRLFHRFHSVAIQLRTRHENRSTLDVADEYDVQDLLRALLYSEFDDVRPEEWTLSYAGKSARVDFLLKPERIVVETKKTRLGLSEKELGDQLIIDITRYSKHPDCKTLMCLIYDPEDRIRNPGGFQTDLSGDREGIAVEVIVVPKRY